MSGSSKGPEDDEQGDAHPRPERTQPGSISERRQQLFDLDVPSANTNAGVGDLPPGVAADGPANDASPEVEGAEQRAAAGMAPPVSAVQPRQAPLRAASKAIDSPGAGARIPPPRAASAAIDPRAASAARPVPPRPVSKAFEPPPAPPRSGRPSNRAQDPSSTTGAHLREGLPEDLGLTTGARPRSSTRPANDTELEPEAPSGLIRQEFNSLASISQFEPSADDASLPLAPIRLLTHVAASASFDVTLKLPKPNEAPDGRRARLTARFKSATAAYKLLSGLGLGAVESKELVDIFNAYEARLRAVTTSEDSATDADALHGLVPMSGLEELERQVNKLEERLLAYDDSLTEQDFCARVTRDRQPPKVLLRYARLLASRRFNLGYRRDRFEHLALQLLIHENADGRLQLVPRDKAANILSLLLGGLSQQPPADERGPATAHLREALERLAEISSPEAFFDSEFFLDLHGYKISMRDQITSPEFLYLCAALETEINNRLVAWSQSGTPSLPALEAKRDAQKKSAEEVFTNFRRPNAALVSAQPSLQPPAQVPLLRDTLLRDKSGPRGPAAVRSPDKKESQPPADRKRRSQQRRPGSEAAGRPSALPLWKLGGLALVIAVSLGSVIFSSGLMQLGGAPEVVTPVQLERLSPLLLSARVLDGGKYLEGSVSRPKWLAMNARQRREFATALAAALKDKGILNAQVMTHLTPVVRIEFSTVVQLDESAPLAVTPAR